MKNAVTIELDLSVVQEAIKTHTVEAVTVLLGKHYDIPKMIEAELLREPKKEKSGEDFMARMFPVLYSAEAHPTGRRMIESMVRIAIREIADEYVKAKVAEQRSDLEAAFRKMMQKSPDKLVKAFVGAIESGMQNDWAFEIAASVKVKEPERSYGD